GPPHTLPAGRGPFPAFFRPRADGPPRGGVPPAAAREHGARRGAAAPRRRRVPPCPPHRRAGGDAPAHRGLHAARGALMTTLPLLKTRFTPGEVAPPPLRPRHPPPHQDGAARPPNPVIHAPGGVTRRAGLRHVERARRTLERYAAVSAVTAPNGGIGANANDDDPATKLVTATALGATSNYVVVQYDLGTAQPVLFADALELSLSAGALSDEFHVQYSNDGSAWSSFDR